MKKIIISAIALLLAVFVFYITIGERHLLAANKQALDFNGTQSIKIVQFSDTHLGEYFSVEQLEKVVEKINMQKPDLIVFCGDLLDIASKTESIDEIAFVLEKISAPLGKLAIYGNRDYGGGGAGLYSTIMSQAGFTVLVNEAMQLTLNSKSITVYGADDYIFGSNNVKALMSGIDESSFNILLSHEPDAIMHYTDYPVDLALSGHSHGGQVRLPIYGELVKTNFCNYFSKGLYSLENPFNTKVFVTSGLGNTKLPFRFGNIPEIVVFDLKI